MKKVLLGLAALLLLLVIIAAWLVFGGGTAFNEKSKPLYVYTGKANKQAVLQSFNEGDFLKNPSMFTLIANQLDVWDRLKPGKYEIKKGASILSIAKMLRNNQQTPVKLVINKLRTAENLAHLIGKNFEADSAGVMAYLENKDSLSKFNVDENTAMTLVIPNTYEFYWSTPTGKILKKLSDERDAFWKRNNRLQKAEDMNLSPNQVYTIASIVEEETNKNDEKGNVASVYINRYHKGMPLGADPTIKFALKDFSLKRIYFKHLAVVSPYNTYRNKGLPPGPICTPSTKTIDAVLNAPKTDYLFFVARSDFKGYHTFSVSYAEHQKNAAIYQKALDELILRKQKAKESL